MNPLVADLVDPASMNPEDLEDAHYVECHPEEFAVEDLRRAKETIDRAYEESGLDL